MDTDVRQMLGSSEQKRVSPDEIELQAGEDEAQTDAAELQPGQSCLSAAATAQAALNRTLRPGDRLHTAGCVCESGHVCVCVSNMTGRLQ